MTAAKLMSGWHVAVAAEAATASLFARCGLDVSVQYGADQPEYDLVVVRDDRVLKISVKGSQDGSWGLTQSFLRNADYPLRSTSGSGAISRVLSFPSSSSRVSRFMNRRGCIWQLRGRSPTV